MSKPTPQVLPAGKEQTRELGPLVGRALFDAKTINKAEKTVEVVFATETPVRQARYVGWDDVEYFDEILSMNSAHVRMTRINSGAPVLNNHYRYDGVLGVLGVIEKAWIANGEARAILRFSKREDVVPIWNDVVDGILVGISVGYRVYEYEITKKEGSVDQYRAIDWEPFEISFAPVQADVKSAVRSGDAQRETPNSVKLRIATPATENRENTNLNPHKVEENAQTPAGGAKPAAGSPDATRAADTTATTVTATTVNVDEAKRTAIEGERARTKQIRDAVRAAKLDGTFADELIDGGHTIEKARELIIAKFAEADPAKGQRSANPTVTTGADEADKRRTGMENALIHRSAPDKIKADEMKGNEFRGMSLIRMAESVIKANGGSVVGMSNAEIARFALGLGIRGGMHSTSDFPIILGNTVNRRLQAEYALAPQTFKDWTTRGTAQDFRELTRANMSEIGDFKEVKEGGEYKNVTLSEGAEKYKIAKYGEKIAITWETLVNDDLSAFNRLPAKIAQAAARKQSDIVYAILTANAAMGDGVALFHNTHKNLMTAAAISIDSLAEGRKLMRNQKGKADKDFLNLSASFLIVGPDKEKEALQYTSADYLPNTQAQVNPYKSLKIVVEPRLTGNQWYLMVTPGVVDTVEYAFLEGEGELYTETRQGFDVDGVEIKARMVFGAKALDWKGMYKNVGA
jgi:hypothetical protein